MPIGPALSMRTFRPRLGVLIATGVTLSLGLTACGGAKVDQAATNPVNATSCVDTSGDTIKIGFLNSLSGTMAISEKTVNDSLNLAAEEINAAGGALGKKLEIVTEDGASEPTKFAEKAQKLITSDCTAAVFERNNSLLFYPVQYEGLESSKNIFYTGATTNQQIIPALDYLRDQGKKSIYLVGSDYVFPRTANKIITAYAAANGMEIKGEEYAPLGHTDFSTIIGKVRSADADAVFNTLNGDSNVAFFKEYRNAGLTVEDMPVMSVSIAEEEVTGIGLDNVKGQLTAWNYFQTLDTPTNQKFVAAFKARYGDDRVTSDPMESAYTSLYLWKGMVEKANSFDVPAIQGAADGVSFEAPEGTVTIDGENHHIAKTAHVGRINDQGLIDSVWNSGGAIEPDPYLKSYPWAAGLS
jgi:urea transport system substrate-binding protein